MNALRQAVAEPNTLVAGSVVLDTAGWSLSGPAGNVPLHGRVYRLTERLMQQSGALVPASSLIAALWPDPDEEPRLVEVALRGTVCDLRAALRAVCPDAAWIRTERQVGYALMTVTSDRCFHPSHARGREAWGKRPAAMVHSIRACRAAAVRSNDAHG